MKKTMNNKPRIDFRVVLDEDDYKIYQQIREENPAIKSNHDLLRFLFNSYLSQENKTLHEIKNLKIIDNTILNILGELMFKANGFRDVQTKAPLTSIKFGDKYVGVIDARKKVLNDIQTAQQKKFSH